MKIRPTGSYVAIESQRTAGWVCRWILLSWKHNNQHTGSCDKEVKIRIGKANSAFKRLDGIRCQKCLGLRIKIRLYESLVLAILLYCAETWPVTEANRKRLEGFHHNCLRRILNIIGRQVKNEYVRRKTGQSLLECTLQKRRLRWFGHVHVWKTSVMLGKHYTRYQLKRGKEEDRGLHGETE